MWFFKNYFIIVVGCLYLTSYTFDTQSALLKIYLFILDTSRSCSLNPSLRLIFFSFAEARYYSALSVWTYRG